MKIKKEILIEISALVAMLVVIAGLVYAIYRITTYCYVHPEDQMCLSTKKQDMTLIEKCEEYKTCFEDSPDVYGYGLNTRANCATLYKALECDGI